MKNFKHLFTALLLLFSVAVNAHNFEVSGIFYNITDATNKTVAVTYRGNSYDEYSGEYTGDVVIPETVTYNSVTYSVTSIGHFAFGGCRGLTSIEIPNSVTGFGNYAFRYCRDLTSIEIPNSVTSIGSYAFEGCSGLTSIEIPNSVTSIGESAFEGCSGLTSIEIPNSVTSIGDGAFDGTAWYNNQPNGLIYAGKVLYKYKGTMPDNTSITIKDGTLGIAGGAFYNCDGLTSVVIGNSVTSIGDWAFYDCSGLTSIEIPGSVTSIGESAFRDCSGLTSIEIPNSVTSIGSYAFSSCLGLTSVTIGNSVTSIGSYAFSDCSGLTSVTIGNSVTSIGNYAFNGCSRLTSIEIPNSVTSIGDYAFYSCSGLTSVVIGNSVTSIGEGAFNGCSEIKRFTIPNSVTSIGNNAFYGTAWYDNQPDGLIYAGKVLYEYKGTMPGNYEIVVKDGTLGIAGGAFQFCSGLTSIVIPNSVTSIGDWAFSYCSRLTSIEIPNSVTSIGSSAFSDCERLTSIEIPNSVTSIGRSAFSGCYRLTSVTIGNNVTSIGESAFSRCEGLKTVINFSNLIFTKGSDDYGRIAYYADNVLNLPNGSIEGDFGFAVIDGVNLLVAYLGNETEITLPDSYKGESYEIAANAFKQNSSITNVNFTNGVTSIGEYAFSGCISIEKIALPNSLATIGDYAFYCCYGLKNVVIPKNVASIGEGAFENCTALAEIRSFIPAERLFVPDDYAFEGVDKDACILYVPQDAKEVYATTAGWSDFANIIEGGNMFTVTYIVDGEVYATDSVSYGEEIVLIEAPVKEGYTFSGWSEVPAIMPAEDITVTGTFTKTDTGIDELEGEMNVSQVIYDLQGRKVTHPIKGIYIINGRKVVK